MAGGFHFSTRSGLGATPGWRLGAWALILALGIFQAEAREPLRVGILPVESPLETRNNWEPVVHGLAQALTQPAQLFAPTSYEAMAAALRRHSVDLAVLSGDMAIDAVVRQNMRVIARVLPMDVDNHRTVLVGRRGATPATLDDMLSMPAKWRLARGETHSLSGYVVPQLQLFLPRGLRMEAFFSAETPGTHQANALAVANGEADVGLTTTGDLLRFKENFPWEYARLAVLWQSDPLPSALVVARRGLPASLRERTIAYLSALNQQQAGRAQLARRPGLAGFEAAGDAALLPSAHLLYRFERESALRGRWTNEASRQARLQRIDREYAVLRTRLDGTAWLKAEGPPP